MSLIRKVTTNAGVILLGTLLQRAIQLLVVIYIARHVSVEAFGQYNLALAIVFVASFFVDLGIGPASVREIARNRDAAQHLFSHILALRLVLSFLLYGGLAIFTFCSGYGESTRTLILLLGISLFNNAVAGACETLNIAFENMRLSVVIRFIGMAVGAIASIGAMSLGYGLVGLVCANLVAEALTAIFWAAFTRRHYFHYRLSFDVKEWRRIMGHATPFALMIFFQQINRNLNVILLSKIPGPMDPRAAIGYYSAASQVARIAMPLLISVRQAIIPSLAADSYDDETHASLLKWTTKGILVTVCFPLTLGGVFFAKDLLTLVFGPEYREGAPAFAVLCSAFALQAASIGINGFLSASRDISRFVKYAVVSVIINVVITVALIPNFGLNGAALGTLAAKLFEVSCAVFLCRNIWGRNVIKLVHYIDVGLMGLALTGIVFAIRQLVPGFWLSASVSAIVYLVAAGLLVLHIRQRVKAMTGAAPAVRPDNAVPLDSGVDTAGAEN